MHVHIDEVKKLKRAHLHHKRNKAVEYHNNTFYLNLWNMGNTQTKARKHTHTHMHIVCVCVYVCMCVCVCVCVYIYIYIYIYIYRVSQEELPDFGRVFLRSNYTDITQNTYVQSWTVKEIMAREVSNFDSCYTLIDYQIHIKTGMNMWFL